MCSERRQRGPSMPSHPFFYGLEPRWLTSNHLYRIYVRETMLSGAWIAKHISDQESAAAYLGQLAPLLSGFFSRESKRRREREYFYDSANPFVPKFLDHDSRNFQVSRAEVVGCRLQRRRSYWTPFNVGTIELKMLDGSVRKLILYGDQDADAVLDIMRAFDPSIDAVGVWVATPIRRLPNPRRTRWARRIRIVSAIFCSALFGLGFCRIALQLRGLGLGDLRFAALGIASLLAATWMTFVLIRTEQKSSAEVQSDRPSDDVP